MRSLLLLSALLSAPESTSTEVIEALAPTQGGLTTAEVIDRALKTAPSIDKAQAEYLRLKTDADYAFLGFVPRVDGSAGYARLSPVDPFEFDITPLLEAFGVTPPPDLELGGGFPNPQNQWSFIGRLSIPVSEYFLVILHGYNATIKAEEVGRYQLYAQRESTALFAVETYLNVARARANTIVAKSSIEVLEAQLQDLQRLADAGLSTQGDVLQVKAQLASTKVAYERALGALAVAKAALRRVLHAEDVTLEHGEDLMALVQMTAPPVDEAVQAALSERAEVKALLRLISSREDLELAALGSVFPRLTVDADAIYARPNQRTFYEDAFNATWQVGINLRWSPNDALLSYSQKLKAEENTNAARADLASLVDAITVEVTSAVSDYQATRASIAAAGEGVEAAEGTFADRQRLLEAGTGTTRELLLSEQDLRRAQLQLINAHLDLRLAKTRLDRALGRLVKEGER